MRAVGSSLPRIDAAEKVDGSALYPGDIDLPNQAWLKIVFAGFAHGRITAVDTAAAAASVGVLGVLTAADVPVNEYGLIMPDQPVLCGLGSTSHAERVRWEADHVAFVVAETLAQAEAAAKLVKVEHEPLPVVTDPVHALNVDAPILHPDPFHFPYGERDWNSNVLHAYRLAQGDLAAGFAAADVIVESTYCTQAQEHAYLQPEAGLAYVRDDDKIEVICAGQWMHEEREQIAHAMGMDDEQIVVRHPAIGGAFGGREDISIQIALALCAQKFKRPVKTIWSREESIIGHHKRHPYILHAKWGATRDGKLVAAEMDVIGDAGAYAYTSTKVLGNAVLAALGPYTIPNLRVDARAVYTNNCPSGAFRGFGGPQGHFAAEAQMNKLAVALEMDPIELRLRNVWREGDMLATRGVVPPGCTAHAVVEEAARRGGWQHENGAWQQPATTNLSSMLGDSTKQNKDTATPHPERLELLNSLDVGRSRIATGRGVACCFKNVGYSLGAPESCAAWVELHGGAEITRAVVACVGADVGQGAHTVFQQIAAEALEIDPALVELHVDNTEITGSSGSASASRMSFMAGNAVYGAATRARLEWENEERPARADYVYRPPATTPYAPETGESAVPNITFGYCAQVAEVAVDLDTGHIQVTRLISVNDVGRAINPQQVEGQIEGAVAQSVGWTLMENFVQREGKTLTPHLSNYLIPGVLDTVQVIEPVILEFPDPQGPLGVRGMAEMPFIPTAPAITAAVYDATGVWIDQLPLTPPRVWAALQAQQSA